MNKSSFVVLAIGLFFICSVAEGADWKFYGATGNDCGYYYDVSSVKTLSKGIKQVWTKRQAESDKCILDEIKQRTKLELPITGYENYSHTITADKIDCSLKKYCTETFTDYDNKGSVLGMYTSSTESWKAIVPESAIYRLYEQICK